MDNLVVRAARELTCAVQENYYDLSDLNIINYSEVCEWCNFPDLQDGGIYEQAIDAAAKIIIEIIKQQENNMKKTVYLYVERDDSEYDYKAGFASYTEANDYRQECQRSWMGHCDYVYLWTGSEGINLTRMPKDERNKLLKQFNIPE